MRTPRFRFLADTHHRKRHACSNRADRAESSCEGSGCRRTTSRRLWTRGCGEQVSSPSRSRSEHHPQASWPESGTVSDAATSSGRTVRHSPAPDTGRSLDPKHQRHSLAHSHRRRSRRGLPSQGIDRRRAGQKAEAQGLCARVCWSPVAKVRMRRPVDALACPGRGRLERWRARSPRCWPSGWKGSRPLPRRKGLEPRRVMIYPPSLPDPITREAGGTPAEWRSGCPDCCRGPAGASGRR